jgi:hypothetical protein
MREEMIIVADDIHMNRDMIKAWRSIVSGSSTSPVPDPWLPPAGPVPDPWLPPASPVPATLETLRTGMLFCIPSITPGHYRVRY